MGLLIKKAFEFQNDWSPSINVNKTNYTLSVVVPSYNHKFLDKMISHLSKMNDIYEIIIVDDSPNALKNIDIWKKIKEIEKVRTKIIYHKKSLGAPCARNTGAAYATGDILVFVDQDIFLDPSFLINLQRTISANKNHALVLGGRKTVKIQNIPDLSCWKSPDINKDWRRKTIISDELIDITVTGVGSNENKCHKGQKIRIYDQTSKLKKLGVSPEKTIGFWDLPSMVVSHSMALTREDFFRIGGFPEWNIGWGSEDTAIGFLAVSDEIPIILTESMSYHVFHTPYSGSFKQNLVELSRNIKMYQEWGQNLSEFPKANKQDWMMRGKEV